MDLGAGVWAGGNGPLCALRGLHRAVARPAGTGRIWKHQHAESVDFSGRVLERVAIGDPSAGGGGNAHTRRLRPGIFPAAAAARVGGASIGADRVLRGGSAADATGGGGAEYAQGRDGGNSGWRN